MIRNTIIIAVFTVFALGAFTPPALASHCPKDVKKIQAAMSKLDKSKMSMAKDAAAKGLALHKAGKHGESIKVLHETLEALGIKH
jgi:hypothetical protein